MAHSQHRKLSQTLSVLNQPPRPSLADVYNNSFADHINGINNSAKNSASQIPKTKDIIIYEVEIINKKAANEYNILQAAEKGICVCKNWQVLLIGNLIIVLLIGICCAVTLIVNIPKDSSVRPFGINDTCSIGSSDCDKSVDLICPSGKCVCNSNKYWYNGNCVCADSQYFDGFYCVSKRNYSEACTGSGPCYSYLICQNSVCTCESTKYFTSNSCVSKKALNSSCISFAECQDFNNLSCIGNVCTCAKTHYIDGTKCSLKKSNGTSCTHAYECDDNNGLNCTSNVCVCSSNYYWNSTKCLAKKSYDVLCDNSYECSESKNLICQTVSNACNCPSLSMIGICDCPSATYWDNTACITRKSLNGPCALDYMCTENSGLVCTAGKCICPASKPTWNGSSCV